MGRWMPPMAKYHFHHNDDVNQSKAVEIDAPDEEAAAAEFSKQIDVELTTKEQDVISDYNYVEYGPNGSEPRWTPPAKGLWLRNS